MKVFRPHLNYSARTTMLELSELADRPSLVSAPTKVSYDHRVFRASSKATATYPCQSELQLDVMNVPGI